MIKDTILGIGTLLALFCAFLLAGFVAAVFFWTCRFCGQIIRFFKSPAEPEDEKTDVEKFLESKNIFVRDPLQYRDKNNNGVDDLDEIR